MTLSPRRLVSVAFLTFLGVASSVRAADEPGSGTFSTPGYSPRPNNTGGPPMLGTPQGPGSPASAPGGGPPPFGTRGSAPGRGPTDPTAATTRRDALPPTPPQPPSEFQRFVEAATGRLLPIFGARFFADAGQSFQSLDNVPVSADYTLGPGDEVLVRAWGSIDVDYRATVDRNGMLNLPRVGSFNVAGVKASDLERNLRAQIGRLFTNFDLSVSLGQLRGLRVFVVGPAQWPGVVTLASQSTLLSAVVAAGGPSPSGSMRKVLLRRDGRVISELDVYEFLVQGDKSKDLQLAAGDVVVFQPVGPRVAVTGSLDTPAIYELRSAQEPVRDVLRYAGGTPVLANPNRVQLERVEPSQPAARFVETFRLDAAGLGKALRDGDVLTLLAISPQFANAVTLHGHVAQPLRYPHTPGMRIRDLIPDREALITPDFYRRKNLLVQVVDEEELARETERERPPRREPTLVAPVSGIDDRLAIEPRSPRGRPEPLQEMPARRRAASILFDEINWEYATIERLNPDLSTQVVPFDLRKAVLEADPAHDVALQPGDVVTIYGVKDIKGPTSRQTRLVSLEGEVGAPGVYQLAAGDTLQSLIRRAGGFTAQAYVYGIEFSREETRARQRENLATAIARLQSLAAVQTARDAANRRDDVAAVQSSTVVSSAATQAQLARLSRIEPNGRIALELTPETQNLEALPDLPLEHGDRIFVPPRPGFITVAGAVVNSNAFVWKPGRTAGDYLRLAGAEESADTSNMFILRADGTVNSASDRRGFFGRGGLEGQPLQPGDALVVPTQLDFETWGRAFVRNLKDFAQIFSGFGIGIAAINSIRN